MDAYPFVSGAARAVDDVFTRQDPALRRGRTAADAPRRAVSRPAVVRQTTVKTTACARFAHCVRRAIITSIAHQWPQPGKATVPSDCIHQLRDAAQQPFPALGIEFRELGDFLGHVAELVAIAVTLRNSGLGQ